MVAKAESTPLVLPFALLAIAAVVFTMATASQSSGDAQGWAVENVSRDDPGLYEGKGREVHGAVSPKDCLKMLSRYRKEGRRLDLKRIVRNPFGSGGFALKYICIFEGPDADPVYYRDTRYEVDP